MRFAAKNLMNGRGVWIGLIILMGLSSCVVQPVQKRAAEGEWRRTEGGLPQILVRAYYGTPEQVKGILTELGDEVRSVRRWARQSNGAVSVRFVDERGRALKTVESGGHLIVEGQPGQAYAVKVRNETAVVMEVLPMVDGLDLETGLDADLGRLGRRVGPRQETIFGSRLAAGGAEETLRFGDGGGPEAVHRVCPTGTAGSVVLAVFLAQGDDSFGDLPARERIRSTAIGQQGTFPQRRYEPLRLPYQYR